MRVIRWKFVVPLAVFIAVLAGSIIIFLDPFLARAVEAIGSRLNGAKVDIHDLETEIFKGRLSIGRIEVASRREPMTNRFEAGPLVFQLDFPQLLKKKVIIPESRIDNIQPGTPREVSGALPGVEAQEEKEPGFASRLADRYGDRFSFTVDQFKGDVKKKVEFDEEDLGVVKSANALEARAEALPDRWKARVDGLQVESRLDAIEAKVESVKDTQTDGAEAVTAIPKALATLKEARSDLQKLKADIGKARTDLTGELTELRTGVARLDQEAQKDFEDLSARFNLDFADPQRLLESLIGAEVMAKFLDALRYVELARRHMPSKDEKAEEPARVRGEGADIRFPTPAGPPKFWLKTAALSGAFNDIALDGSLTDATSDPPAVGRPMILNLDGRKEGRVFKAMLTADHTGDIMKDSFVVEAKNVPLEKLEGGRLLSRAATGGMVDAEFVFYARGESDIGGGVTAVVRGLGLDQAALLREAGLNPDTKDASEATQAQLLRNIAAAIERLDALTIGLKLVGTWEDPAIRFDSNLAAQMPKIVAATVGDALKDQRADLRRRIDAVKEKEREKARAAVSAVEKEVADRLATLEQKVQREIQDAAGINLDASGLGGKIPGLKDLFK